MMIAMCGSQPVCGILVILRYMPTACFHQMSCSAMQYIYLMVVAAGLASPHTHLPTTTPQAYTWIIVIHAIVAWLDAYGIGEMPAGRMTYSAVTAHPPTRMRVVLRRTCCLQHSMYTSTQAVQWYCRQTASPYECTQNPAATGLNLAHPTASRGPLQACPRARNASTFLPCCLLFACSSPLRLAPRTRCQ
jgi:hypothetical protein